MKHYILTNRPVQKKAGKIILKKNEGNDISSLLYYGELELSANGKATYNLIEEEPDANFQINYPMPNNAGPTMRFFRKIYNDMREITQKNSTKRDILLFIHGYGHSLEKSFKFLKELENKYVNNPDCSVGKIIMFMWPSKSHFISYSHEQDDARASGNTLANFYIKLKKFLDQYASKYQTENPDYNRGYLHVVVQSMGNLLFQQMIEKLNTNHRELVDNIFKEIILVGADIESDVFEEGHPLSNIIDYCSRVHVYYHKEDLAMKASRLRSLLTFNFRSKKPLGKTGPNDMRQLNSNIKVVDVSELEDFITADSINDLIDDKIIQHRYFMYSTKVVKDITEVLNGKHSEEIEGRRATDRSCLFRL
ncbi:MAG: alpha/beta hydrolase [Fimbriimonadaceae bacterium]|nr:alpha/beta hydrolase [Chitinophagales bacterium]